MVKSQIRNDKGQFSKTTVIVAEEKDVKDEIYKALRIIFLAIRILPWLFVLYLIIHSFDISSMISNMLIRAAGSNCSCETRKNGL